MSTRREKPGAPPAGEAPHPSDGEDRLLTSKDLFGDMVDAQAAPKAGAAGATRSAPIKVQVGEPGAARNSSPLATDGAKDVLPDDVAALLDAFSGPAEEATRQETGTAEVPPGDPEPEGIAAAEGENALLDELVDPAPPSDWDGSEADSTVPPQSVEALFGSRPPAAFRTPEIPPPPSAADGAGGRRKPSDLEAALADLRNLQRPRLPRPAAPLPEVPVDEDHKPKARTATKFSAVTPTAKAVESGGLDLAALAEEAFASAPSPDPAAEAAPESPGAEASEESLGAPAGEYGPYRLLERVAVGGMAEVFRAKRAGVEGFEKVVAVKRILSHLSDNKEFVDMFIDEAKMVSGLSHPNIVQIFDLGKIERSYFIAMDYVHGRDLRSILKRAKERGLRIPLDISAHVVSKVCAALEYAHRKRDEGGVPMMIVHRDVSPQNIMISFEGDVKLTDFGIAKAATKAHSTDKGALRGKLLYMSPEQAWGKPLDKRSDVFSLGVVFYEMLTEQKPFLGSSDMSILETVRECRVAPPSTLNPRIPDKLERVVIKSLERDPELRYQDAGEMLRDLERVLHEWQPATSSALVRFLEILFDEAERGAHAPNAAVDHPPSHTPASLEVELPDASAEPAPPPPDAPRRDPMSIQKLLKRFGIK